MTHRAEQIIRAAAAIIRARVEPIGYHVYTHRRLSLDPESDEMPAISVDYGPDEPVDEETTHFIDSELTVIVTAIAAAGEEESVREQLLAMRRETHVALLADDSLGLDFVVQTSYGGAGEPAIDVQGSQILGELPTSWVVYYRMNRNDPAA